MIGHRLGANAAMIGGERLFNRLRHGRSCASAARALQREQVGRVRDHFRAAHRRHDFVLAGERDGGARPPAGPAARVPDAHPVDSECPLIDVGGDDETVSFPLLRSTRAADRCSARCSAIPRSRDHSSDAANSLAPAPRTPLPEFPRASSRVPHAQKIYRAVACRGQPPRDQITEVRSDAARFARRAS